MKFGDVLRELLDIHGLSQKQLADDLHISPGAVGNYVRNKREPDYQTLIRIATYFDVSTDFLLNVCPEDQADRRDQVLLHIFCGLTDEQKDLYIEQGKVFLKSGTQKDENSAP